MTSSRSPSAGATPISIASASTAGITASADRAGPDSPRMQARSASPTSSSAATNGSSTSTTSATDGSTRSGSKSARRRSRSEAIRSVSADNAGHRRKTAAAPGRSCNDATRSRATSVEHLERLVESVDAGDRDAIRDQLEVIESLREWLDARSVRPTPGQSPSPAVCRG